MVRVVEGDEALRLGRGSEQPAAVLDRDDVVRLRMQHQERFAERGQLGAEMVFREVVEHLAADPHRPHAAEVDLRHPLLGDLLPRSRQGLAQMGRVGRRAESGDRLRLRKRRSGRQHRGAAEAVADQQLGGAMVGAQEVAGRLQVIEVGMKVGLGEVAVALAEAGEVEPQHTEAAPGQLLADPTCHPQILGAGEAMGEQGEGGRLAGRQIEPADQLRTERTGELYALSSHEGLRDEGSEDGRSLARTMHRRPDRRSYGQYNDSDRMRTDSP